MLTHFHFIKHICDPGLIIHEPCRTTTTIIIISVKQASRKDIRLDLFTLDLHQIQNLVPGSGVQGQTPAAGLYHQLLSEVLGSGFVGCSGGVVSAGVFVLCFLL